MNRQKSLATDYGFYNEKTLTVPLRNVSKLVGRKDYLLAVFILEDALSVWTDNASLVVCSSVKTGRITRRTTKDERDIPRSEKKKE